MNSISIPDFVISQKDLDSIKEQIQESETFEKEIFQNDWLIVVSGTAKCFNGYEEATNCSWSEISKIEITLKVYDTEGDLFDFSDEFEKDIFGQINVISK